MAQAITLARPYARAAFEAGARGGLDGCVVAVRWRLPLPWQTIRRLPASATTRACSRPSWWRCTCPQGMAADAPFAQFLGELAEHRRMALLPEVAELFESYKREAESQLLVKVTSAMALDAAQTEQLKASLKRRFKREIELETQVDASLLAGVVIDTGSEVIDGSARGRLAKLASALASREAPDSKEPSGAADAARTPRKRPCPAPP